MDFRVMDRSGDRESVQASPGKKSVAQLEAVFAWGRALYHRRQRVATIAAGLLAAWMAFHVFSGPNGWVVYRQKQLEHEQLEQQVEKLRKENEDLERRVNALKSDPHAIEKEAREQLRYVKPGEVIYVMPNTPAPSGPWPVPSGREGSGKRAIQ
jgi:cell division protein FtsB